jgi:hypothetical protein
MTSAEEDTASEVETCSDLFYPVPRCLPENLNVVTMVSQDPFDPRPGMVTQMAVNSEMTLAHWMSLMQCPLQRFDVLSQQFVENDFLLNDSASFQRVDLTTPLVSYSPVLYGGNQLSEWQRFQRTGFTAPAPTLQWSLKKSEPHDPLRLVLCRNDVSKDRVDTLSVDTGIGASTIYHHIEELPGSLVLTRGSAWSKSWIPRHGQLKKLINIDGLRSVVLKCNGTLGGSGKRAFADVSVPSSSGKHSQVNPLDDEDGDCFADLFEESFML